LDVCSCNKVAYGTQLTAPDPCWRPIREGFMGQVFECERCGTLWFKTMGGHGEFIYIKSKPEDNFGLPSKAREHKDIYKWNSEIEHEWNEIISKLPKMRDKAVGPYMIPGDVMTILSYTLENDMVSLKKWLHCPTVIKGEPIIPITTLTKDCTGNKLRFLALEKYKHRIG